MSGPRRASLVLSTGLWLSLIGCEPVVLDFFPDTGGGSGGAVDHPPPQAPEVAELVVDKALDLSTTNTASRKCGDGGDSVSYRVAALSRGTATLSEAPSVGCLEAGDEVLLIKLQGNADSIVNVGEHELLRVDSLNGKGVSFVSEQLRHYGATLDKDDAVDAAHVLLQRVPSYSRLEVRASGILSGGSWSSGGSGALVVRVLGDAVVDGSIDMTGAGFRGGPPTEEALGHGTQGESLSGAGSTLQSPNQGGGGGGLGDQTTSACVQDGNAGGGGGHEAAGSPAVVLDLCEGEGAGAAGLAYAKAGLLFLGSGGGSGGVDNVRVDNPPGGSGGNGGGLVWLLAQSLSGTGTIVADGTAGAGDPDDFECEQGGSTTRCFDHSGPGGGGAGGSVRVSAALIRGVTLAAAGGPGGNGFDGATGNGGDGASGVIE